MLSSSHVLTISARDYCDKEGKKLEDYDMVGVHSVEVTSNIVDWEIPPQFNLKIPSLSEVVVGYQSTAYLLNRFGIPGDRERKNIEYFVDSHGTALIPKS